MACLFIQGLVWSSDSTDTLGRMGYCLFLFISLPQTPFLLSVPIDSRKEAHEEALCEFSIFSADPADRLQFPSEVTGSAPRLMPSMC